MVRQAVERVGFQNFVEDKAGLEEGNCLMFLLLLEKSFFVLDIRTVTGSYIYMVVMLKSRNFCQLSRFLKQTCSHL